jgi:hypothetical protein
MPYQGSCHCGAVKFEVAGDSPTEAMSCNCSHCRRKGFLLTFVPAENFSLEAASEAIATYSFNTHKLSHRFCRTCGVQPFAEGVGRGGAETRAVNLRCVPTIDINALKIEAVDGAAF